ncbi:DNA primase large subunit [Orussus abietinus]|uniref:DNA primase large subunit n=1 Tax=Orussus abietinus TaxID=222816 RepID=UPI000625FBDC|nr:DNA primase large subunit [Orussus abietinus]
MEFVRKHVPVQKEISNLQQLYPHDMQFYKLPPMDEISLSEFEEFGRERVKVLRSVETILSWKNLKSPVERREALCDALNKDGLTYFAKLINGSGCSRHTDVELQARRRDHISHFIARLSFCRNNDLRRWFTVQEVELFKLRFSALNKEGTDRLLEISGLGHLPISEEEKEKIRTRLHDSTARLNVNIDKTEFYKVRFENVTELVRSRKVFLKDGFAYVPQTELVWVFLSHYKRSLCAHLQYAHRSLSKCSDDERIYTYLENLCKTNTVKDNVQWDTTEISIDSLDELSKISYPLCMRVLHEALRTKHHLKNSGRVQYGLFIKGIGVTLEDSMNFWKTEFCHNMDGETFDKKYSYHIRHSYGKEGKRTNYTPMSCNKIINSTVGPGECHGCPFRHVSYEELKQKLTGYGLYSAAVTEIADTAKEGHYQVACSKYFQKLHNTLEEEIILHPNRYFHKSRELLVGNSIAPDTQPSKDKGLMDVDEPMDTAQQ